MTEFHETPTSGSPPRDFGTVFDRDALVERIDSDLDLLRQLLQVFEEDGPGF